MICVYVPQTANAKQSNKQISLHLQISVETSHPAAAVAVLGDINLSTKLPKYKQHASCPSRGSNTLHHCCVAISKVYHQERQVKVYHKRQSASNDTRTIWEKLKMMTNYKKVPLPHLTSILTNSLPDKFNKFYRRFEQSPLYTQEEELRATFRKKNKM